MLSTRMKLSATIKSSLYRVDLQEQKQRLREKFLKARTALSLQDYLQKSDKIISSLIQQPEFIDASVIHCYVSMKDRLEVNTRPLIRNMMAQQKGVAVPVTDFETVKLKSFLLDRFEDLEENKWGVMEPKRGIQLSPEELDLVVVPMVGGDEQRNRIGYGKGFYDRFLSEVDCPAIGLTFECCVTESVPVEEFDIPLHKVITEERVIS